MNNYTENLIKLVEKKLWAKVVFSMILGILVGLVLKNFSASIPDNYLTNIANWLSFPGKLFMKLIQMVMIALIVSSIIVGITTSSKEQLKIIGTKSLLYFFFTTIVAVTIATVISFLIQPGNYMSKSFVQNFNNGIENNLDLKFNINNLPDLILNLIPENPLEAMIKGDMLSIVIFSFIIGIATLYLKKEAVFGVGRAMEAIQNISMNIVNSAMKLIPYAVFGIMVGLLLTIGSDSIKGLLIYVLTVVLALIVMFIFYLLIVYFVGKVNPFIFLTKIKDAILLAFSTTSSAAVMPLSLKIANEKLNIKPNVSNIIIPMGATINMDGTAVYQCVSFIFITQIYGLDITVSSLMLSLFTIILASIGTPAVPGAGIIVLASVLKSAGLPNEGLMIIIGVERILGMFRASINVMGDLTACIVFNKILK
jgi:Na+/H+-dicarboxylate symporter